MNTATKKQSRLARALYRNLVRSSREIPPSSCLQRYNRSIAGVRVEDVRTLQEGLRAAFQQPFENGNIYAQAKISEAITGLQLLNSLDVSSLPSKAKELATSQKFTHPQPSADSTIYHYGLESALEKVNWINVKNAQDSRIESSDLPFLPVLGPTVPEKHEEPMPLVGHLYDVPLPGYHLNLPIFEDRFVDLYEDAQKGANQIVVPFPHPIFPGVFAEHGLLYEIRGVEDMKKKTNGRIKFTAHHLVLMTPVRLQHVANPSAFHTEDTYMRIQAEVVDFDFSINPRRCKENHDMIEMLRWWMCPLAEHLYGVIDYGPWGLAGVWIGHLQKELMELQANVIARVENRMDKDESQELYKVVEEIQGRGYKERMIEIQVQLSTMIPRLLAVKTPNEQYLLLQQMISDEQERQRSIEDNLPLAV